MTRRGIRTAPAYRPVAEQKATDKVLSKEWEKLFQRELGGVTVRIEEGCSGGCQTSVQQWNGLPVAVVQIGNQMVNEIQKVAGLRHEHGHLELDSFSLRKQGEIKKMSVAAWNVIEDVRINLLEGQRYRGFREGMVQLKEAGAFPEGKALWSLLFGATQGKPANADEQYIFEMAHKVNEAKGGVRGEYRGAAFYDLYLKYARAVLRYVGDEKTPDGDKPKGQPGGQKGEKGPKGGQSDSESDGDSSDSEGSSGGVEPFDKDGKPLEESPKSKKGGRGEKSEEEDSEEDSGGGSDDEDSDDDSPGGPDGDEEGGEEDDSEFGPSDLEEKADKPLNEEEKFNADSNAQSSTEEMKEVFSILEDIGVPDTKDSYGALVNGKMKNEIPVDLELKTYVEGYLRKLRLLGSKNYEAGTRMNTRMAARAKFTGETKLFQVPTREDVKNAKFVILQDVSGSMGGYGGMIHGKQKMKCDIAYHFGMTMAEFLKRNGAKVECYRFGGAGFTEGLSYEADAGSEWIAEDLPLMRDMIASGKQLIILSDGDIVEFEHEMANVVALFARAEHRPVGLQLGCPGSFIERACPEWKDFTVDYNVSPDKAMDNLVKALSKRFVF
jgi:hypothetical protein